MAKNSNPEGLRLETMKPAELSADRWHEIQNLRKRYYMGILAGKRTLDVVGFLNKTTREKWDNPNRAVGSDLTREGQAFTRARVAAAFNSLNELVGVVYFADNASSAREHGGGLERFAKLHVPTKKFRDHRYRVIRETIMPSDDFSRYDAAKMLAISVEDADDQPVTGYPVRQEADVINLLEESGMREAEYDPVFILPSENAQTKDPAVLVKLWVPHADMLHAGLAKAAEK